MNTLDKYHEMQEDKPYQLKGVQEQLQKEVEKVQTPEHYQTVTGFDVIDFNKAYKLNFNRGNIVKYVSRAGKKEDELKDLKKALDYLQREIKYLEDGKDL